MTVSVGGTLVCFLVTQADRFTSAVYNDVGFAIVDTGCDCNGNSGGSNVNVTNVNTSSESYSLTSECQSPQNEYYSETIIDEIEITFRGVNNTLVVPNEAVQYRTNGGVWVPLTVTTSSITLSVTLTYGDRSVCEGGGTFADTLDIKVGTITVLNYVAGQ
jgi:pectate lyase